MKNLRGILNNNNIRSWDKELMDLSTNGRQKSL
jgi:hypothetical protein